jgi:hypothetical protein
MGAAGSRSPATLRDGPQFTSAKPRPGHEIPHTKRTARNAARKLDAANPQGIDPATIDDPDVRHAYIEHVSGTPAPDNVRPISSAPSASPTRTVGSDLAGAGRLVSGTAASIGSAILGAFAYALLINVIKGTGTAWVEAKFTNGHGSLP